MDASHHLIYCTCPDHDTATRLAKQLVECRLAACVNVLPGLTSVYRWNGCIEQASETLLLIKTHAARLAALLDALARAHPYEVPEIIAVPIVAGLPGYLNWIEQETQETD